MYSTAAERDQGLKNILPVLGLLTEMAVAKSLSFVKATRQTDVTRYSCLNLLEVIFDQAL